MPLMRCSRQGKSGWKFGPAGFCFTGPTAQDQARKQGIAVLASEAKASGDTSKKEVSDYISSHAKTELKKKT